MLPATLRYWLFDTLSVQTMRYVTAIPTREAKGLTNHQSTVFLFDADTGKCRAVVGGNWIWCSRMIKGWSLSK